MLSLLRSLIGGFMNTFYVYYILNLLQIELVRGIYQLFENISRKVTEMKLHARLLGLHYRQKPATKRM